MSSREIRWLREIGGISQYGVVSRCATGTEG